MLTIDGVEFSKATIELKRSFQVLDGENSGRVLTGDMMRDVIGTYYNYSAKVDSSFMTLEEYDELYEIISAPVESHTIEVPYGQTTYVYKAYITNGSDDYIKQEGNDNFWNNLSFNFIAMSPKRRAS